MQVTALEMVELYNSGKTVKEVATLSGVSTGKAHKILKNAGCVFRKSGKKEGYVTKEETRERLSEKLRGRTFSPEAKRKMSEAKRCDYNGLNGYGHTKKHNRGYVLVYVPNHPKAHKDGYVMLHTVVMERHIGRYIKDDEVVHHKNGNREDNRIENLELMSKQEHMSMHMKKRWER